MTHRGSERVRTRDKMRNIGLDLEKMDIPARPQRTVETMLCMLRGWQLASATAQRTVQRRSRNAAGSTRDAPPITRPLVDSDSKAITRRSSTAGAAERAADPEDTKAAGHRVSGGCEEGIHKMLTKVHLTMAASTGIHAAAVGLEHVQTRGQGVIVGGSGDPRPRPSL